MSAKLSPKTQSKLLDVFLEDPDMKYYSQRIKIEEKRVRQLLSDITDFVQNPIHNKAIIKSYKKGAPSGIDASPTKDDLADFRATLKSSIDEIARNTPKRVPMIWRLLDSGVVAKISEVIRIKNNTLPELQVKFQERRDQLNKQIKVSKQISRNASSIAVLRSSELHPVWTVVASKVK